MARRPVLVALAIALSSVALPVTAAPKIPTPEGPVTSVALAPGNDAFASATEVTVGQTVAGSNVGATTEESEPLPCGAIGATVWYRLTVSEAASVAASTGGGLDTVLAVYRGSRLDELEGLGCNDDSGWSLSSKVGFAAVPGEIYHLQVGGYAGDTGGFTLALDVGGSIAGVVTGEGEDLGAACVDLYAADGEWLESSYVLGPVAAYRFAGLDDGGYKVGFTDCSEEQRHVAEYHDDAPDLASATAVTVAGGAETGGVDASLALGGAISGTVAGATGDPVPYACVDVVRPGGSWVAFDEDDGDGFLVGGLPPGDYLVRFEDCWFGDHAFEWYDDADSRLTATPVTVEAGQVVSGIDAELSLAAHIAGSVTSDDPGDPIEGVCVQARDAAGDIAGWGYGYGEYGYSVGGLRGSVTLRFEDCGSGTHAYEWFDDAATRAAATPVATTEGEVTSDIDASLGQAGWVQGRITNHVGAPVRWTCVEAFDAGGDHVAYDFTGGQGRYTLRGLRAGDVRLRIAGCWGEGYRTEWWDGGASFDEATPVPIVAGDITSGIDAVLEAPRLVFLEDGGWTSVAEGGSGDRFGVGLGQASTSDITVTLETDGQIEVEPAEITFGAGDATVREIRVEAVDDDVPEGSHTGVVTLRTAGEDPALGSLVQRFWVSVEDDDLVPLPTEVVYEGDTSAPRGTTATFAARLVDAETGEGISSQLMVLRLGNQAYPLWTDEEGYAERDLLVSAPYGTYEVRVVYPGSEWLAPSEVAVPFEIVWQHVFEDDLAAGRSVLWNPPTREIRFVAPGDISAIKEGASSQSVVLPTGRATAVVFSDASLTVELDWDEGTGAFAAAVNTAANAYVLQGTS